MYCMKCAEKLNLCFVMNILSIANCLNISIQGVPKKCAKKDFI